MIINLKTVMVDASKIEAITPHLSKYETHGCEYKIQISGIIYKINERDYPRDILIKRWEEAKK